MTGCGEYVWKEKLYSTEDWMWIKNKMRKIKEHTTIITKNYILFNKYYAN